MNFHSATLRTVFEGKPYNKSLRAIGTKASLAEVHYRLPGKSRVSDYGLKAFWTIEKEQSIFRNIKLISSFFKVRSPPLRVI